MNANLITDILMFGSSIINTGHGWFVVDKLGTLFLNDDHLVNQMCHSGQLQYLEYNTHLEVKLWNE